MDRSDSVSQHIGLQGSVVAQFETVRRAFPSKLAVQDSEISLTYSELAVLVDRIATATHAVASARAGPVALLLPANAYLPAAMLGALTAGRAYVPLNINFPIEHNRQIISDAGACAVISASDCAAEACMELLRSVPVIDIDRLDDSNVPTAEVQIGSHDLAAIYYTSGSSGRPKGVAWSHANLLHWVGLFTDTAQIVHEDRLLLVFSPSVSASYRSIYCALLNGASLHVLDPQALGMSELLEQIRTRRITIFHSVPRLVRRIADCLPADNRLDSVRIVSIGGDRILWKDVDECRRCFSKDVLLYTILSSTETGTYIHGFLDGGLRPTAAHPPVGSPTRGWKVTIVDTDGQPVSAGESGDIVVSGRYIAPGYWDGSNLTIRSFPSDVDDPSLRVFKTGDRGRIRPDGLIEFVGRKDRQIKLHGHRIEPAEIESALLSLRQLRDAAVVVRLDESGDPVALVAYVVLQSNISGMLPRHVQSMLAQRLPRYMVPSAVVVLDELPYLPSFKVDLETLAKMDAERSLKVPERTGDPTIDEIARIFETAIGVAHASAEDTIASIGGNSLQAIRIGFEIERRYGITIPDDLMAQHLTIRAIALWLKSQPDRAHRELSGPQQP